MVEQLKKIDVGGLVSGITGDLDDGLLPEIVGEIVTVIGMVATIRLIKSYGGGDMRVPVGTADSVRQQEIVEVIGEDSACEFMEVYGGTRLYIPRCNLALKEQRNLNFTNAINDAVKSGLSKTKAIQSLAVKFGITERWGFEIVKAKSCYLDDCLDQPDFFGF